jgi:outer membrane protein OmpA-like peptidoglycan-associated protein
MNFIRLFPLIFLLSAGSAFAQVDKSKLTTKNARAANFYERAARYFDAKNFEVAKRDLLDVIRLDPQFIEAYMLLGDVHFDLKEYEEARDAYMKAVEIDPEFFTGNWYNLARAEMLTGEYALAKAHLEKYLSSKIPESTRTRAQKYLEAATFGDSLVSNPVPFDPVNLGDSINTRYHEYFPTLTIDEQTLIFTRRLPRTSQTLGMNPEEEDFYISRKIGDTWEFAQNLGPPINTPGNEGAQAISPDGKFLYYTACNRPDGLGSCDLYVAERRGNTWGTPRNMGPKVNSSAWDSQPSISFDGITIYFASSRSGGQGKIDIWKTTKGDDGIWSQAVNLGPEINTPEQDITPFIHSDDQTLYFASEGHRGLGGLDIFYSRKNPDGSWGKPVNIGYPINTHRDENSLIINAAGNTAFFASDRLEGLGGLDLYQFELYKEARPVAVSYVKGNVTDAQSNRKLEAAIEITDVNTGEIILTSQSDKISGDYLIALPPGKDYVFNASKPGYLFHSENFSISDRPGSKSYEIDIELMPIKEGNTVILKNIFFDTDKYELKKESQVELKKLKEFLTANPEIKIEVSGHTDSTGDKRYNQTLSEKRAKSVYDFLIGAGISGNRLTFKGYGDNKPIATNETEEGKAKNRRTVFTIISGA